MSETETIKGKLKLNYHLMIILIKNYGVKNIV